MFHRWVIFVPVPGVQGVSGWPTKLKVRVFIFPQSQMDKTVFVFFSDTVSANNLTYYYQP